MFDQLASVSLCNAQFHGRDEASLVFEHANHRLLHELLRILAARRGHLLQPGFDIGREMHFHNPRVGTTRPTVKLSYTPQQ